MKHLKQLAYLSLQFHLKEILIIGVLSGSVITAFDPASWFIYIPSSTLGCFFGDMIEQHKKYKLTGKY